MAKDLLYGRTKKDLSISPEAKKPLVPSRWWAPERAEKQVLIYMRRGGSYGSSLPRREAEKLALEYMRGNKIGVAGPVTMGSWLLPLKQQQAIMAKIDDVRYDVHRASGKISAGLLSIGTALGLLGIASIYRTSKEEKHD